jgi:endoglucanase
MILVGQRIELLTRGGVVPGVVGKKPIHLLREEERKKVPEIRDLHLDIGAPDGDAARAAVRVGDVAVIAGEPVEVLGDRVISRSMDNRLGSYIALAAARLVAEGGGAPGDVAAVGVVQEEITFAGARTTAFGLQPDVAIAVDVTHATDAPGIDVKQLGKHPLGSGPVLERGSILHPALFEHLHATGEAEGIEFTVSSSGGRTFTDADAVFIARQGIPVSLVSVPLRYMHSPVEVVSIDDVENAAQLIAAASRSLPADLDLAR